MKTRKFRRSKRQFPTHIVKGTRKGEGHLVIGEKSARQDIERKEGISLEDAKKCHTKSEWVWRYPE